MKVFTCPCGSALSVARFTLGDSFQCPSCGARHKLTDGVSSTKVYTVDEVRTLQEQTTLIEALPGHGPAGAVVGHAFSPGNLSDHHLAHYRIIKRIGKGAMGAVYEGHDTMLDRIVALKVLPFRLSTDTEYVERFRKEAQSIGSLNHSNIIHVYYVGVDDGNYFFAMERVDGRNLEEILDEKGKLDVIDVIEYILQAARGLEAAHRINMIHRDIKPANLMLGSDNILKIADFGLAKDTAKKTLNHEKDTETEEGMVMGTPLYMSPEQATGHELDFRSDIYSLGMTAFHLLTGKSPFQGNTAVDIMVQHVKAPRPSLVKERIPHARVLNRMLQRMVAVAPEERYQSYAALIKDMEDLHEKLAPSILEYAGFWSRMIAFIVDAACVMFVASMLHSACKSMNIPMHRPFVVLMGIWVCLFLAYEVLMHLRWGRSAGKMLLRLFVMNLASGGNIRTSKVIWRSLSVTVPIACWMCLAVINWKDRDMILSIGMAVCLLHFLWMSIHKRKQGFHDMILGAVVVAQRERFIVRERPGRV